MGNDRMQERYEVLARQYEVACGVPCVVFDSSNVSQCMIRCPLWGTKNQCDGCEKSLKFNFGQSLRFGGSYVFFCPGSLMFWASPLLSEAKVSHGLIAGPVLVLPPQELDDSLSERMGERISELKQKDPGSVSSLAEVMRMVSGWASEYQDNLAASYRSLELQGKLFDILEEHGKEEKQGDSRGTLYFTQVEEELFQSITKRDLKTAQAAAEKEIWLFSHYHSNEPGTLKVRMQEMITLFSRAAIQGRADEAKVWALCQKLYSSLTFQRPMEALVRWMKDSLALFIDLVGTCGNEKFSLDVDNAVRYAEANFRRAVPLGEVASYIGISPNYLCRVFRKETGKTWVEYMNGVRVTKAKELLSATSKSMLEIGEASGFGSQITFCKVFRRLEGMSPSSFRKQNQKLFFGKK